MKKITALALVASMAFPAIAAERYTDANGCVHIPINAADGSAAYWNLDANTCARDLFTAQSNKTAGDNIPDE
jgi:hypothetical protein